ncbi:chitin disaccharide deacetylase [Desmospora profundinema]|uniref:Carbohydrate deacetylase n=1 Tax=Desmospora profundinema TaxID=1571184 RepID=A0ABU1IPN3_9BACL|nr:chitin disaccharide deacetylase [Desmospora profundinema]MDR6226745.1 putative glycoside hydrolase/deacetylase ChbG (UPF0249 family) [Desmospora profundinema]
MVTNVIVNADDFGYSKGVNLGILESFQQGVVTSTTMMVNMPAIEHAAALAKQHPDLDVGIHLVLTCGKPVHPDVPSLVDERGMFHRNGEWSRLATEEDIEREWTAQIERFLSLGLKPTHLDSHHHVHGDQRVLPVATELAEKWDIPMRLAMEETPASPSGKRKTTDRFIYAFYGEELTKETFIDLLDQSQRWEWVEIMCHPAYLDMPLLEGSSYALQRVNELSILTDPAVLEAVKRKNIQLARYRDIQTKTHA